MDEVLRNLNINNLNRVVLLSDGLANTGITNPIEITRLVRGTKAKEVQISTMGLGLNYNEDLMQAIAEHASANYYFIENPLQTSRIFQQEMDTLFTTVAKDVLIQFEPSRAVQKVDVFGYLSEKKDTSTHIQMENFYSGDNPSLLLRLEIKPGKEEEILLGNFHLSYFDLVEKTPHEIVRNVVVTTTDNTDEVKAAENKDVIVESILIEAEEKHERYVGMYEQGDKKGALESIAALAEELLKKNLELSDTQVAKKLGDC